MSLPSEPITRKESYLAKAAGQDVEIPAKPITREEEYLDAIAKGSGGGGGGTTNYNDLSNQPQIGGVTLSGNKSASDLGLADSNTVQGILNGQSLDSFSDVEIALNSKQGVLTEGDYISIENNEISVNPVVPNEEATYQIVSDGQEGGTYFVRINKIVDGEVVLTERYSTVDNVKRTFDDTIRIDYANTVGWNFTYELLVASTTHDAGYTYSWGYATQVDINEVIVLADHSGDNLVKKSQMDTALTGKQNALTAGSYIAIESDAIRVNRTLANPIVPYTYRVHTTSTDGTYASVDIDKKDESGVVIDSVSIWYYEHQGIANAVTMDDFIQIYYDGRWICNLLKNSETHQAGYQQTWNWNQSVDFSEVYDMEVDLSGQKLIIKDEMDTALADKQNTLTFDSVPTDGSTNPVESNGVYDALAGKQAVPTEISYADWQQLTPQQQESGSWLVQGVPSANLSTRVSALESGKQDKTDNTLATTTKTVVGAINEVNSNIASLQNDVEGAWTELTLSDVITISQDVTLSDTPSHVYRRGNRIRLMLNATGTITLGAGGYTTIGVINNAYRPSYDQLMPCIVNTNADTLNNWSPAVYTINFSGNVNLVLGTPGTIGSSTNPWSPGTITIEWALN